MKIDQKKLRQVVIILLDNALKYTESGDRIHVSSRTTNKHWYIEVENTGANISDDDKERIFERFYRDDHSRASDTGGYGLGLAIAKQIIEAHQGQISVHDLSPQGVRFQIRLSKNYGSPTFGVDEKSFTPFLYKNTKRHMNISYAKI